MEEGAIPVKALPSRMLKALTGPIETKREQLTNRKAMADLADLLHPPGPETDTVASMAPPLAVNLN